MLPYHLCLDLQEIRAAESMMDDSSQWGALTEEQKKEKREELDKNYSQVYQCAKRCTIVVTFQQCQGDPSKL